MSQHYDIMSFNAVMLLASGYMYVITGEEPSGFFLLFLSLCNVIGIIVGRLTDLETYRKEREMLEDMEGEYDEDEDYEDKPDDEHEEVEEEEEEEEEPEDDEPNLEDQLIDESDVHYCGSEECGEEITNLEGAGLCAGCELVYYCNTDCQKADWKAGHKLVCDRNTSVSNDSASESVNDTVAKLVAETVDEIVDELVAETLAESVAETLAESVAETLAEAVVEPTPIPEPTEQLPVYPTKFLPPPPPIRQAPPPPPPSDTSKPVGFDV